MSQFDDRINAFEAKFANDESLKFRVNARRDKLFALWAAELQSMPASGHDSYVKEVIAASLEEIGDDDILRKVSTDLEQAGVAQSHDILVAKLADMETEAKRSIAEEIEN